MGIIFLGLAILVYERWKSLNDKELRVYNEFFKLSVFVCIAISINLSINFSRFFFVRDSNVINLFNSFTIIDLSLLFFYATVMLFCRRQLDNQISSKPIKKAILAVYSLVATTQVLFGGFFTVSIAFSVLLFLANNSSLIGE